MNYPKRLIEVDLPIKRISAHARREKSIRHGHISTLHIWWARRPLAACRAVICAALWPDPADPLCPQAFRESAARVIQEFAAKVVESRQLKETCDPLSFGAWVGISKSGNRLDPANPAHLNALRNLLLDFIADFANWDNSTVPAYLDAARALTQAAHEALGGAPGSRPLVVDPFAGGGSIPLEALRVGADAFASDLNPVAVLLNKVVLEYIPRYGQRLADEVRKWGQWIKEQAEQELAPFYPKDPDGATPIAYLWARTIRCEGPGCGAEVPLMRSLWLAKKGSRSVALRMVPDQANKRVDFAIIENAKAKDVAEGTVRRGSGTCPVCGYTTPVESVRRQLKERRGGAADARLVAVVTTRPGQQGRFYRLTQERDLVAVRMATEELERRKAAHEGPLSLVPDEEISYNEIRRITVPIYGMNTWGDIFSPRQKMAITALSRHIESAIKLLINEKAPDFALAVSTILGIALSRFTDICNSLCMWEVSKTQIRHAFTRQALPMLWDFAESNAVADAAGNFNITLNTMVELINKQLENISNATGQCGQMSATIHSFPDDSAQAWITDPPYYDAVPYAYLSDFFYVWMRRILISIHKGFFALNTTPKADEIVVDRPHSLSNSQKDILFYEDSLTKAFTEGCRITSPSGIAVVVFASKTTASWEAILKGLLEGGWTISASWPIDSELPNRLAAHGQARLASSVHLVCRPRENPDGSLINEIGDWRTVLAELPQRIHEWMPRLAQEGVVGADAIFACLGPALEVFSRYSRVEKASGEVVALREYLEQVWAAVAKEALDMIFKGVDTRGFEQDARLTAIWFWVMKEANGNGRKNDDSGQTNNTKVGTLSDDELTTEDTEDDAVVIKKRNGYVMEFDAARKLAQGLGVNLVELAKPGGIIFVQGSMATLLSIKKREEKLIGRQAFLFESKSSPIRGGEERGFSKAHIKTVNARKSSLFDPEPGPYVDPIKPFLPGFEPPKDLRTLMQRLVDNGSTMLDRLHQTMLLFGQGQTPLIRPFLSETGMDLNNRFWTLAQALSALYPPGSEEKRWVDGVLARKKGLGL